MEQSHIFFLHERTGKAEGKTTGPIMLLVVGELGTNKIRTKLYETSLVVVVLRQLLTALETNNHYFHTKIQQFCSILYNLQHVRPQLMGYCTSQHLCNINENVKSSQGTVTNNTESISSTIIII